MKETYKKPVENGIPKTEEERQAILEKIKASLKPCPICGNKVYMHKVFYGHSNYSSGSREVIRCDNCGLEMKGPDTSWECEWNCLEKIATFADKWNTRCGETQQED